MNQPPVPRPILGRFLGWFFRHLYTTVAWSYDIVAWLVSIGQWRSWQQAGLDALPPGSTLEIGHGPGHLLLALARRGKPYVGLDASPQMGRLAQRRLRKHDLRAPLILGRAQALPFVGRAFGSVLLTFPSEYIFELESLHEITRVLAPGGNLVVVLFSRIHGRSWYDRVAAWLFRITGQSGERDFQLPRTTYQRLMELGLQARLATIQQPRAEVTMLLAVKESSP
jgi:ubiquinone/menaquinone biosynthesis C-methylase UbiE